MNASPVSQFEPLTAGEAIAKVDSLLSSFAHFGVELGLERIERLLAALGNPERQVQVVHVAGSNGKGSVCAYVSAVLQEAGYRVGRYTSPHLVSWCERICLNQQDIEPIALYHLLTQVIAAIDPAQASPTQFEVITAAAWLYFAQQRVDIAVMEVGLGGRLDATNVCDRPLVSVITSLSREHWQRLGPTLADISREKAGILKSACPAAIAPQPPEAAAVLQQRLADLQCPVTWVEPAVRVGHDQASYQASYQQLHYTLPLPGAHQLINSAVAIAALQWLQKEGWQISDEQIVNGIAKTKWQGRLQWFAWQGRKILIDGAHNPAGAKMLRQYVDQSVDQSVDSIAPVDAAGKILPIQILPIHWVIGMISTKDHAEVLQELLRPGDRVYLVPVPEHLPIDLNHLALVAREACPQLSELKIYGDVLAGLQAAMQFDEREKIEDSTPESLIVLAGSLYLIGHFFQQMRSQ